RVAAVLARPCPCAASASQPADHPLGALDDAAIRSMSRFRSEVAHLEAHVRSLRLTAGAFFVAMLFCAGGWWHAPRNLTIHVPPDLRSGSVRKWWDVPPESVYAFAWYIFQQLHRWPTDGEQDY